MIIGSVMIHETSLNNLQTKISKYNIDFPLQNRLTIVNNYSEKYKRAAIETLHSYLIKEGEDVLFFDDNRKLMVDKERMEAYDVAMKLADKATLRDEIEKSYDISDPFSYEKIQRGGDITCGYLQLMNFFYSILLHPSQELNVIIYNFHNQLHALVRPKLIYDLRNFKKIKRLIVTTTDCGFYNYMGVDFTKYTITGSSLCKKVEEIKV